MSFILDALKKSETERQRADAPALYEMKLAAPRRGVAAWLIVLAGLLVINVVVLSIVLLHGSRGTAGPSEASNPATPPAVAPVTAAAATPDAAAPAAATVMPATVAGKPPAGASLTEPAVSAAASGPQAADSDDAPAVEPSGAVAASGAQAGAQTTPQTAVQASTSTSTRGGVTMATGVGSTDVPTYQQVASEPGANLPELKLDLHSYATNPADRFVFLNMVNLKEGQTSPAGVRVESITPDGAILSWHGSKFFLQRQ